MLSAGSDRQFKVFDIRRSYKELFSYFTPKEATKVCYSQTNVAAVSSGSQIYFWKDCHSEKQKTPFFKHDDLTRKPINDMSFIPYEDFMGVTCMNKFQSIFVPGTGSKDYDTYEINLNSEIRQNREITVKKLLEKVT